MNSDLIQPLLLFAGSAVLVIFSGVILAKYGDALGELMGWGRLWTGTILLAVATSLPEVVTTMAAATRNQPELALGNILGSTMVNMLILAIIAMLFGGPLFFRRVSPQQSFLVSVAIALTGLAVLLGSFNIGISLLKVGLGSLLILALYLGGIRLVYLMRQPGASGLADADSPRPLPSLGRAWAFFGLASLGVLLAAPALAYSVEQIAETTGLAKTFLGVVAVAVVTSMPEISTTLAAVRFGAIDLGVGNLYGSCAFNVLILALADPFYRQGTLVEAMGTDHMAAGLLAILLMTLGLSQIALRGSYRYVPAVPVLGIMILVYIGGLFAVYKL